MSSADKTTNAVHGEQGEGTPMGQLGGDDGNLGQSAPASLQSDRRSALTAVVMTGHARGAVTADDARLHRDPVTHAQVFDSVGRLYDDSGELVTR